MDVHRRDLRSFVVLAEELHLARAAGRLATSEPSLRKQVEDLEHGLGVELFERGLDGDEVRLTDAGRALVDHARAVLDAWSGAEAALEAVRAERAATLVVGMPDGPGRHGLVQAVRSRFTTAHPDMVVRPQRVSWADPAGGLADGSSDVAYLWLPLPDEARYRSVTVADDPLVVAMAEGHPFAERDEVAVGDLVAEPLLAPPPEAGRQRDRWLLTARRDGVAARVGATVRDADEAYRALVDGVGLVVLAAADSGLVLRGGVVVRPLATAERARLALVWRAGDDRPSVAAYVDACRQVVAARSG